MRHIKTASKQIWIAAVIIMALILSVACTAGTGSEPDSGTEAETTIISGQVVLTDGTDEVALPDGSQIIVQVQDTSRADAPAVVLGEQIIINAASLPAAHEISVESAELEEVVQASVAVRVEDAEGQLLYINDTIHPVSAEETAVDVAVIAVAAAESESALPPAFAGQVWQWLAFQDSASGEEGNDITVADPAKYTLELLADGTYTIQADCNSGSGQYTLDGSSLTLEPGPITLAACDPDSHSNTYVSLLGDVATFVFDGEGNLVLSLKADAGDMVFARADEAASDLEGTSWVLSSLATESGVTSSEIDQEITAVFEDGQMSGSAGCNSYFAGYEIEDGSLTLSGMGNTAMSCDEARNEREGEFLAALQTVTGYRLDGDTLVLLDADGNTVIEMQVAEMMDETAVPDQLLGTWQWQSFEDSASSDESNDITVDDPAKYTLELMADGSYAIQADCNSGGGQYTIEDSSISLEPGPMTLAECGPESFYDAFVSRLGDVVTFVFDSDVNLVLNLKADAGNMVFAPAK